MKIISDFIEYLHDQRVLYVVLNACLSDIDLYCLRV